MISWFFENEKPQNLTDLGLFSWWEQLGSNQRPPACKPCNHGISFASRAEETLYFKVFLQRAQDSDMLLLYAQQVAC